MGLVLFPLLSQIIYNFFNIMSRSSFQNLEISIQITLPYYGFYYGFSSFSTFVPNYLSFFQNHVTIIFPNLEISIQIILPYYWFSSFSIFVAYYLSFLQNYVKIIFSKSRNIYPNNSSLLWVKFFFHFCRKLFIMFSKSCHDHLFKISKYLSK